MTKRKRSDKSTASGASLGGRNETASVPAGKAPDEIVGKLNPTRPDIPGPLEVGESRRSIQALIRGAEGKLPTAIARRFVDAELLPQSAALALYAMMSLAPCC